MLSIRRSRRVGVTAREAFRAMAEKWYTGTTFTAKNLADIADSSINQNANI